MSDPAAVSRAARHLARAPTPQALDQALGQYPELLPADADSALTQAIQAAAQANQPREVCALLAVRAFLADCRQARQAALQAWAAHLPLADACPLPALARPKPEPAHLPRRVELARLALRQLRRDTEPIWWATAKDVLGEALLRLPGEGRADRLREAIRHLGEALEVWQAYGRTGERRDTLIVLDQAWEEVAGLDPARHLGAALEFYETTLAALGDEAPAERALLLHTLGNLYAQWPGGQRADRIERALGCFQQALRLHERGQASDPLLRVRTLISLANAYLARVHGGRADNIEQAIQGYQLALAGLPDTPGPEWAEAHANLAVAHRRRQLGSPSLNLETAIEHADLALQFFSAARRPECWAVVQELLGTLYGLRRAGRRSENIEQAIQHYQAALSVYTRSAFPVPWARTISNLANAYCDRAQGDPRRNLEEAVRLYQAALEVRTRDAYPTDWAETQNNLGTAYAALGQRAQAAACYDLALQVRTPVEAPAGARQTAANYAALFFQDRRWEEAADQFDTAIEAAEVMYAASLTELSKERALAENVELYRYGAYAHARAGRPDQALLTLDRGKTRLLRDALQLGVPRPAGTPDSAWTAFEQAGAHWRAEQAQPLVGGPAPAQWAAGYHGREQAARRAYAGLQAAIEQVRQTAPNFLRPLDLPAALQLLPADGRTALAAFCLTAHGSQGYCLGPSPARSVQVVDVPGFRQADLDRLLFEAGGWVEGLRSRNSAVWQSTIDRVLGELGAALLRPVLAALPREVERLILLPSGGLFLLPLHAAPLSAAGRVCDRYEVSYAPSLEILADCQRKAAARDGQGLYLVVNPTDDPALAFTQAEGSGLEALFAGRPIERQAGGAATRAAVMAGAAGKAYLHFACHGSYNWQAPADSGLRLADGALTLADLKAGGVDLSAARVVTLSACETGLTDVLTGSAEEYVGLPAGFLLAGVPCVVSSLWPVPDLATGLLLQRFYDNHLSRRLSFAAALHEAQRWLRDLPVEAVADYAEALYAQCEDEPMFLKARLYYRHAAHARPGSREFAHPDFWAAFTVHGW